MNYVSVLKLPVLFIEFWYLEAPRHIFSSFESFNKSFLELFSFFILLRTYFQPWKNEYRKGLVGFSIGMGMFIKTWVILVDAVLFMGIVIIESLLVSIFLAFPIVSLLVLFY